ncbi:MAG: hypothetical protein J6I53_11560, partial [Treponema sp.]|nr:hypothetical protein [Treponema sp.]
MKFSRPLHIEYILIFIAVMTFSSTAVFKSQAMKKFDSLDQKFIEIQQSELDISEIEKDCVPYTYFDKNLSQKFQSLRSLVLSDTGGAFAIELSQFQNEIHKSQRGI